MNYFHINISVSGIFLLLFKIYRNSLSDSIRVYFLIQNLKNKKEYW